MNSRSGELAVTSDATEGSDGSLKSQYPKISSSWDLVVITDKNISRVILIAIVEDLIVFMGCLCGLVDSECENYYSSAAWEQMN